MRTTRARPRENGHVIDDRQRGNVSGSRHSGTRPSSRCRNVVLAHLNAHSASSRCIDGEARDDTACPRRFELDSTRTVSLNRPCLANNVAEQDVLPSRHCLSCVAVIDKACDLATHRDHLRRKRGSATAGCAIEVRVEASVVGCCAWISNHATECVLHL